MEYRHDLSVQFWNEKNEHEREWNGERERAEESEKIAIE